ncbi:type I pilus biogensis protein FimA [Pseudomonas syringae pv. avii]|uniref:Type I pilus biogensis protein FimA n=2 Tax=Pseudomonas syringae group TaxID=136849 RepID=A0ABY1U8X0_PSESX|nr:fimbrial protein [Pseudomonas syringae]KWS99200.1 hypothetical protein AL046_09115 [Pseudomonas syringae pv. avii]POP98844.1 type 1 fimbrial protein [Pseudomonas syringae pv. avii]SOS27687.1 type I pilus biogensis protein FimA [Pseudomonas syringae pv. avii]
MKRTLLALPLTLLMGAAAPAFANTGTINFTGNITSATCSIEVVDPITGNPGSGLVNIGSVAASRFTAADQEEGGKGFGLRVTPGSGCTILPGAKAEVTFTGTPDASGKYFRFKPLGGSATNVVAVLKDDLGTPIDHGTPSKEYVLHETNPTDMLFYVMYRSTAANVTAGATEADVRFSVAIN